ncbi:TIGR02281 family clan AA aspartic protease [Sphingomonas swuensis]|uniref:TIGR02281 family clan AA aspartic protease n=1 Tax=Sphingomonas swuensis TaxID=977800 RepID=A0ABP7SUC4_9SPHN
MADDSANVLYLLLLLVLVGSSLVGRRIAAGKAMKMGLAWVAVFGVAFALFAFRGEFSALGSRLKSEALGSAEPTISGEGLRLAKRDDGHFWVDARINGAPVRFLVDSGATTTTVTREVADAAKLDPGMRGDFVDTANGTVFMPRATAGLLEVGTIRRTDMAVGINPNDDTSVLGMNFLSSLSSWGVQGNDLVLKP